MLTAFQHIQIWGLLIGDLRRVFTAQELKNVAGNSTMSDHNLSVLIDQIRSLTKDEKFEIDTIKGQGYQARRKSIFKNTLDTKYRLWYYLCRRSTSVMRIRDTFAFISLSRLVLSS